ncbi:BTAD domain-containing putative transcriptional regulator [Streptomyces sp. NPDC059708]|uniref:AfsR/SARP family transcriptional regulator n=1 Tax=Streptomyces sp. NPDC059708 TaxID=3346916 RepID=UPI0036C3141D
MRFGLLGPLTAQDAVGPLVIGSAKVRTLLGILLLRRGQAVASDELKDALWGSDLPATATSSLYNHVTRLRRALGREGEDRIRSVPPGYVLDVEHGELDVDVHEELLRTARTARLEEDWEIVRRSCATALGLWRGEPLADLPQLTQSLRYGPEFQALEEARLGAVEWRCEADLRLGRYDGLAAELYTLTERHPLREGFSRHLMIALHRTERQAEALEVFHRLRRTLADSLGVEPGRAVQEALTEVLGGDGRPSGAEPSGANPSTEPEPEPEPAPAPEPPAPHPVHRPAQLPPDVRHFSGRRAQLDRLDALLDEARRHAGTGPVVLSGPGGVGKTALAVHWAHRVRADFPDGQLHVNLRGFAPDGTAVTPAQALRGLLEGLGVPRERLPVTQEARVALFRTLTDGRRLLILLDNARDSAQVRPLLSGSATSLTLVTSRDQLLGLVAVEGAQPVPLCVMPPAEARELLAARVGPGRVLADPRALDEAVELTAGLPLALAVVGARAAVSPALGLDRLVERLRRARGLDAFTGSDALSDVRAVLSWSYETLSADAARLFRLLAVHPGPDVSAPVAASLAAVPPYRAHKLLTELTQANLVTEGADGRYAFHDLLRAYATELGELGDPGPSRRAALERLVEHFLRTARRAALLLEPHLAPLDIPGGGTPGAGVHPEHLVDASEAREWFSAEHAALVKTVGSAAAAGLDLMCWQLAHTLQTHLLWGGYWEDSATVQTAALEAAERLDDAAARAKAHRGLAAALRDSAREGEAHTHLQRALGLFTSQGDPLGRAEVHLDLAGWHERQGRREEALHHNERALGFFRTAGDRAGEAKALNNVGRFQALLGHHAEALAMCEAARRVFEELGDRRSLALTWDSIGLVHRETGDPDQAAHCFRIAVEGLRTVGSPHCEAVALDHLGDAEQASGRPQAARAAWQRAWELLDRLRHEGAPAIARKLRESEPAPV